MFRNIGDKRFGLTLKEKNYIKDLNRYNFVCICDCGNETIIRPEQFGRTKSCGCLRRIKDKDTVNIQNKRFCRLLVIERDYSIKNKRAFWKCQCDCGNISTHLGKDLRSGKIMSCGCLALECRTGKNSHFYKHNLSSEERFLSKNRYHLPEYQAWCGKIYRYYEKKCANCGSKKKLEAHHIYNFADYPNLRVDDDNGICLCKACHTDFHDQYGRRNTNIKQIVDFLFS